MKKIVHDKCHARFLVTQGGKSQASTSPGRKPSTGISA